MRARRATAWLVGVVLLTLIVGPRSALGGGIYLSEIGPGEVGLASAGWAARAQDAATAFTNPAGMTRLERPTFQGSLQPLYLHLEFSPDSGTTNTGKDGDGSGLIPSASAYYVHDLTRDLRVGVGLLGFMGMAFDMGDKWVGRYYVTDVKLQGLSLAPSLAYRLTDWLSVGAGMVVTYAMLEQKAKVNNALDAIPDGSLKVKDEAFGFAANVGLLLEPWKGTRFGVQYLSQTSLDFEDRIKFKNLGPGLSALLGAAGALDAKLDLGITMPQSVMASFYHDVTERWAVMGNVGWQDWSRFGKVDVTVAANNTTDLTAKLGYKDTWHGALGTQYRVMPPLLLSLGVAYDSSMMDDKDRSPSLPVGATWRIGTGARYGLTSNIDLGVAYEIAWGGDVDMDVNRGPLAGRVSGEYTNGALHVVNLSIDWRF